MELREVRYRKIVWAFDVFEERGALNQKVAAFLRALAAQGPLSIVPIHVLTAEQLNLTIEPAEYWVEEYRPSVEKSFAAALEGLRVPGLEREEILIEHTASNVEAARALAERAAALGADAIVAGSHARRGVSRLLLGSFAETLLSQSRLPVIVLNRASRVRERLGTILVPTDFGRDAQKVFRYAVGHARATGSRLILFHAVPHRIAPILQSGAYLMGGSWVPVEDYSSEEVTRQHRRAELWCAWARAHGVEIEPIVDVFGENIADAIVTLAQRRGCGLVVMQSRHGPLLSALLGSVTRQVLRGADCPVTVVRQGLPAQPIESARKAA